MAEFEKYNSADCLTNRQLVLEHHDHRHGVDRVLEVVSKVYG